MAIPELAGGAAVITGAARGLGKAIALAAAHRGMALVIADIEEAALREAELEFTMAGIPNLALITDVNDPEAVERLAAAAYDRYGGVRLLVNNVGVEALGFSWEFSASQWDHVVRTNFLSAAQTVRAFSERMIAAAEPAFILNIASIASVAMMSGNASYIASKHALLSFSECLYLEMQAQAPMIRVGVALPGPVATDSFRRAIVGSNADTFDHYQTFMDRALAVYGMPPLDAGIMILDQLVQGRFWITTHPEMLATYMGQRAQYLAEQQDPAAPENASIVLGR